MRRTLNTDGRKYLYDLLAIKKKRAARLSKNCTVNPILYIEGTYCDGIDNPNGEYEADMITFVAIKYNVTVMIDDTTKITDPNVNGSKDINDVKKRIDDAIYWFGKTAVSVELDGEHVAEFKGTWQAILPPKWQVSLHLIYAICNAKSTWQT